MRKKRVLGFLLALVLVVTCIPTTAFAEGENKTSGSQIIEETYTLETDSVEDEVTEPEVEVEAEEAEAEEVEAAETEEVEVEEVEATETEEVEAEEVEDEVEYHTYKIYLPEGYDEAYSYPTVYLMPQDGYDSQQYVEDGIQARLDELMSSDDVLSMVIVMPDFEEGDDYSELLPGLVTDVEKKYSVISDAAFRALLGVGVGGYMAFETVLISKSEDFLMAGSHMGDFTSEANPYLEKGAINDAAIDLDNTSKKGLDYLSKHYFYIDGPNEDAFTTVAGGTSDIGGNLEKRTNPYYQWGASVYSTPDLSMVEFNVLDGKAEAEFYLNSMGRSLNRFSIKFTGSLFTSSLTCTPQAVTSLDKTTTATVKFTMNDSIKLFAVEEPEVKITVTMSDPADGKVLYTASEVLTGLEAGVEAVQDFELDTANKADGVNTTISATVEFLGMSQDIGSLSLVAIQDTGTADDELQVDLMGDWHFQAYKAYSKNDTTIVDLDRVENAVAAYEGWEVVQPGLGWWTKDFAPSLNGQDQFVGYTWYIRSFDMPVDFPTEGLLLGVGKFDEGNEVYVNGHLVGSNGMKFTDGVGFYDGSNPWDVNNVYELPSEYLKYGEENIIAVRMCNGSGGGGWYEGPIGVYSRAAYNKAYGKPSVYAPEDVQKAVLALVDEQVAAIEAEDIAAYAKTLNADYFESGYNKERRVAQMAEWFEAYDDIKVADEVTGIFEDKGLYNYQAVRKFTGTDEDGNVVDIIPANTEVDTIDENKAYEVSDYFTMSGDEAVACGSHSRFFYDSYYSEVKGGEQTFRVYLPEGYFDKGNAKRYPTMFLLHGINSQSKAFVLDNIDTMLDEAMDAGEMRDTIVIIPDEPGKALGGWNADMITKDLLPTVDERYRTIDDERYRFVGGCSMGGGGAFNVGLLNPNEFSGVISFYGALSVHEQVQGMSKEYLDQYGIVMVCGNQDMYDFYITQENMSRILSDKDVDHYHYVDNGAHDSAFYLPQFMKAVKKVEAEAYTTNGKAAWGIVGGIKVKETDEVLTVDYTAKLPTTVKKYLNTVVESDYTKETNPDLQVPVEIRVIQDGVVVASSTAYHSVDGADKLTNTVTITSDDLDLSDAYEVKVYISVLEDTKLLGRKFVKCDINKPEVDDPEVDDPEVDDPEVDDPDVDDPDDDDKPGTDKPEKPESSNPVINIMTKMMKTFVNIFKGFFGKLWK